MHKPALRDLAFVTLGIVLGACSDDGIADASSSDTTTETGDGDGDATGDGDGDPAGDGDGDGPGDGDGDGPGDGDGDATGDGDGDATGDGDGDATGDGDGDATGDGDGDATGDGDGDPTGDGDGDGDATGDGDGDGDMGNGFDLVSASYDPMSETATLVFSEAVADVGEVDPAQFRISGSLTYENDGATYSYYGDPNYIVAQNFESPPYDLISTSIVNGDAANEVILGFNNEIRAEICSIFDMAMQQIPNSEVGLYVHYDAGQTPVTSQDDAQLAPIGPDWVLSAPESSNYIAEFGFPNLDPQIKIPCDF